MYKHIGIIFGNCLFPEHTFPKETLLFMKEDKMLCTHFKYHKHKLILFLAAMRNHKDSLEDVAYFELDEKSYTDRLLETMQQHNITSIFTYEIEDVFMEQEIIAFAKAHSFTLTFIPSQGFLTTKEEFKQYRIKHPLFMNSFYIWQRKRLDILMDGKEPVGGKWSFDQENRKALPKGIVLPKMPVATPNAHLEKVKQIVDTHFPNHPGTSDTFFLPVTRHDACIWLDDFLDQRFKNFGPYEDAIAKKEVFLFHSVLSPLINLGLITPREIIEKAINKDVPIASKEGFVRQIIGWREFIRGCYATVPYTSNFFNHTRPLSDKFYDATTCIEPIDTTIKKLLTYSYTHHIERLMVLSNFMLLCEIDPKDVYRWFMELYVDSSDWVMAPNVYGMGQFADDSFATKPYISGSAYILKMSDYSKGPWCDVWDGLYWRFIDKNRDFFSKNPRMAVMVKMFDKLDPKRKEMIIQKANEFLKSIS